MECRRRSGGKGKSRLRVCASKRRIKGLRGVKRKPRRRCSGKKENPGSGFAHQNGEQRVCGEPSANRAGAAAGKKKIPALGLRIKTENKGFAGSQAQTLPELQQGKRKIPGSGFAHQNGEQRVCGESSANRAGRKGVAKKLLIKKPSPFVSKWGKAATAYTHHSILWCPGNLWPGRMFFLRGVKR